MKSVSQVNSYKNGNSTLLNIRSILSIIDANLVLGLNKLLIYIQNKIKLG